MKMIALYAAFVALQIFLFSISPSMFIAGCLGFNLAYLVNEVSRVIICKVF